jgi:methionyl-tRNA formyltransferase
MDEGVDSGDILSQVVIPINEFDDAGTLHHKICLSASKQIGELVPMLTDGSYTSEVQEHSNASVWRRRTKLDGMIDWRMSAVTIHNLVKALSCPYGGATFRYNNFEYKLWKTELVECDIRNIEPSKVIDIIDGQFPVIKCAEHAVKIIKTAPELRVTKGAYL